MSTTFGILDIARRALAAQQTGLNVTGHNIANVNTPGYARQRVALDAGRPVQTGFGWLGTGVAVQDVEHVRDRFIDEQIRLEQQNIGRWTMRGRVFGQIEGVFGEPSDVGLASALSRFWDGWQELANHPQDAVAREQVKQSGIQLADLIHRKYTRLRDIQSSLDDELSTRVEEVNHLLERVADLNGKIGIAENRGMTANDFRDTREGILENLNGLMDLSIEEDESGQVTISLNGHNLVEKESVTRLGIVDRSDDDVVVGDVCLAGTGTLLTIRGGELGGLLEMRDEALPAVIQDLDALTQVLVARVNAVHGDGYGRDGSRGNDFFDPDCVRAKDISLSAAILSDADKIAASADDSPGNGATAQALAMLSQEKVLSGDSLTVEGYFAAMMGRLGVASQEARTMQENEALMLDHLKNQQSAVSGVSLDEEMTNLIKYQHAYEAAARLVTTVDEMMQSILNMI